MRRPKKRVDLVRVRKAHALTNARLCRARRLYFTLFYRDIVKTVSFGAHAQERMIQVGMRMRDRGLYAQTTSRLNLGISVARNMAREREKRYGDQFLWRVFHEARMPMAVQALENEFYVA